MDDALKYAVQLLARRDHTVSDLKARLESRFPGDASRRVIEQLLAGNLLDDRRFAQNHVASRKSRGPVRLLADLTRRGVDPALAREVLDGTDWPSLEEVVRTRMEKLKVTPPLEGRDRARLFRSLDWLGYDAEEIRDVLERLI